MLTNIIFKFSSLENRDTSKGKEAVYPIINKINEWFYEQGIACTFNMYTTLEKEGIDVNTEVKYSKSVNDFNSADFIEVVRELPWIYPDNVRLYIDIPGMDDPHHNYWSVPLRPNILMLGYSGKGKLPHYYLEDFYRKAYDIFRRNPYSNNPTVKEEYFIQPPPPFSCTNKRQTTFIMSNKVQEVLLNNNVVSSDDNFTIVRFNNDEFVCKIIVEDKLSGISLEPSQIGLEVSPIYYYEYHKFFYEGETY